MDLESHRRCLHNIIKQGDSPHQEISDLELEQEVNSLEDLRSLIRNTPEGELHNSEILGLYELFDSAMRALLERKDDRFSEAVWLLWCSIRYSGKSPELLLLSYETAIGKFGWGGCLRGSRASALQYLNVHYPAVAALVIQGYSEEKRQIPESSFVLELGIEETKAEAILKQAAEITGDFIEKTRSMDGLSHGDIEALASLSCWEIPSWTSKELASAMETIGKLLAKN